MGIDEVRAMIDAMEASNEKFVRDLGGPEVLAWMHKEMRRRRDAREAEPKRQPSLPVTTTTTSPPAPDAASSLLRRVETLEAQLKHLTRRLQRRRVI